MTALSQTAKITNFLNSDGYANIVLNNRTALYSLNLCFASAGITTATTTSKIKTVNSVTYLNDGLFQTALGATDNFWTLTGGVIPIGSFSKWLLVVTAGVASVVQSSVSAVSLAQCVYPSYPDGGSIFGYFTVSAATAAFTPGTTTTATGGGITTTFNNGIDKALLPLIADANSGNEVLQMSGLGNSLSLLL